MVEKWRWCDLKGLHVVSGLKVHYTLYCGQWMALFVSGVVRYNFGYSFSRMC